MKTNYDYLFYIYNEKITYLKDNFIVEKIMLFNIIFYLN